MPCPLAGCYATLFPLLSSLVFFTQSAGWRGREGGYWSVNILPKKEWTQSKMRCFPPLIERLVVYTLLHTREGENLLFQQLLCFPKNET